MMNDKSYSKADSQCGHDEHKRRDAGDFAALFAQLDQPETSAAIDGGLMRLMAGINDPLRPRDADPLGRQRHDG
ncbi:MAG: hypothetical protein ACRYG4_08005 [Janthinobacterium lividum]